MKIKILVTYKDEHKILKNDILIPIQTGRALSEKKYSNMIGDDTGDNISYDNLKYSELSAQYWAWKNYDKIGNPDYVGHMQYRRHFIFNKDAKFDIETPENQLKGFSVKFIKSIDEGYINNIGLTKDIIEQTINNQDIIAVKKADMRYINCVNALDDYLKHVPGSRQIDYDLLMDTVKELYPEYNSIIKKFYDEPFRYFYHMFIMKKNIFFEYNKFMFSILFKLDDSIDFSRRGTRGGRVLGYLGEFLLSLFIMKKEQEKYNIKELYSTCVLDNSFFPISDFNFLEKNVIVYSFNKVNFYNGIASVLSLDKFIESAKTKQLIIFYDKLDELQLNFLKQIKLNNINIKLIDLSSLTNLPEVYQKCNFLKIYYTLISCDKIVYLSSQCLFNSSINFDIYNKHIWASKHPEASYLINHNSKFAAHLENILTLSNPYNYISDKIIIINNPRELSANIEKKLNNMFFTIKSQIDIINLIFKGYVKYLPENFLIECSAIERKKYFTETEFLDYINSGTLLYSTDTCKNSSRVFYSKFWSFIKLTPFYEDLIFSLIRNKGAVDDDVLQLRNEFSQIHFPNINNHFAANERQTKLLFVMDHLGRFKMKKAYYGIKKAFEFGEKHKKYQQKYDSVKALIKDAKSFKKQLFKV